MRMYSVIFNSVTPSHRRRGGYILLETVVATGLLIVGLAVIGAQVQDATRTVAAMERQIRVMALAEQHLAELDLGLIDLESVDEVEEGDFGPRHPDYGWRLITEPTALEAMFLLTLEILYLPREGHYREDDFEYDDAEVLHIVYAMRPTPQPVHFGLDFGLREEELVELGEKFDELGLSLEGLDPEAFDLAILGRFDFEDLIKTLPLILDALGMDLSQLSSMLPPGLLEQILENSLLGDEESEEGSQEGESP